MKKQIQFKQFNGSDFPNEGRARRFWPSDKGAIKMEALKRLVNNTTYNQQFQKHFTNLDLNTGHD